MIKPKLTLISLAVVLLLISPAEADDGLFFQDLGDGNYVAAPNSSMGEWIVKIYFWLQDVGGLECPAPDS